MKFCLSSSGHRFARPAGNYRDGRPPLVLDLPRRGRISARKYIGTRKSLPVARTNLVRDSLRCEQISARNYRGKSSVYGWFILRLWPPVNKDEEERDERHGDMAEGEERMVHEGGVGGAGGGPG